MAKHWELWNLAITSTAKAGSGARPPNPGRQTCPRKKTLDALIAGAGGVGAKSASLGRGEGVGRRALPPARLALLGRRRQVRPQLAPRLVLRLVPPLAPVDSGLVHFESLPVGELGLAHAAGVVQGRLRAREEGGSIPQTGGHGRVAGRAAVAGSVAPRLRQVRPQRVVVARRARPATSRRVNRGGHRDGAAGGVQALVQELRDVAHVPLPAV